MKSLLSISVDGFQSDTVFRMIKTGLLGFEEEEIALSENYVMPGEDRVPYSREYLNSVTLPEGLEYIGGFAFYNCAPLRTINIPASVDTRVVRYKH